MTGPFISSDTIVSSLLLCSAASLAAAAAIPSARQLANLCKRLTPMQVIVLLTAVGIATASAQKSGTNGVDVVEGTNEVGGVALNTPQPMFNGGAMLNSCGAMGASRPITAYDIGRGYRLDSVTTNDAISYEMPDDATEVGTWRLTGAYDDVVRADLGTFRFPLGTNLCSSLWAQTWGTARPRLRSVSNELVAVGAPMSAIPDVSRFWTAPTTNDTFLLTWQNFALGRIPASTNISCLLPLTSCLFSAQLELKRNGDFFARSNNVESVYRRINPDDWDDDGWSNEEDVSPYEADEDGFGPHQDLSFIVYSNNYYWVDLVVSNANALVTFESELPSVLPNPQFIARAGATNRVVLLLGKSYEVKCAQPIVCVETSHSDVEVMERCEGCLEICRPVICEFVSLPLLMASPQGYGLLGLGGGGMTLSLSPEPEGYEVSLGSCCCMTQVGGGLPYFYCVGNCGCGGCSSGDISVAYDGTVLAFPGYSCPCWHDPNPGGDDPQEDPDGPGVSASFSHEAIIFEEAYTNMPGVVVPRRSTNVEVSYYVNGGTNGGTYAFTLINGAKLIQVDGGTLPVTGHVAAAESIYVTARYEGRAASGSEGDIIAKAEFTEDETGQTLTDTHSMLTIVQVETMVEVAWLPLKNRKEIGVGECVEIIVTPQLTSFEVCATRCTQTLDGWLYSSPRRAATETVEINCQGSSLPIVFRTVEPTGLVAHVSDCMWGDDVGTAGNFSASFDVYVLPTNVSFSAIQTKEIGMRATDAIGLFSQPDYVSWLDHTLHGADHWHSLMPGNLFFDNVSFPVIRQWGNGGSFTWPIPNVWRVSGSDVELPIPHESGFDQHFEVDSDGTSRIGKFHYIIQRGTNLLHSVRKDDE